MRVKVLSLALLAAIVALPVPASQLLAGTLSAATPVARIVPGNANLATLLQDPFLIETLSYAPPASLLEVGTGDL